MTSAAPDLARDLDAIANRLRRHVIGMTYAAGTGHPGGSLSAADMMAALYFHELRIDPQRPEWPDRDRFLLSKGHACPVWYAALAERGYFPVEELSGLRHISSHLQGHPDMRKTPGVDMTAGPLGSGAAAAAGMALGARITGRDFRTYVMVGEGDLQEGCTWEAVLLAGHRRLDNLCMLIDYNRSQVDGRSDDILCLDPLGDKLRACGWAVREIDGHDIAQILNALSWARETVEMPAAILAHTLKGKGVSFMEDRHEWHGKAPNREQAIAALAELGETGEIEPALGLKSEAGNQSPLEADWTRPTFQSSSDDFGSQTSNELGGIGDARSAHAADDAGSAPAAGNSPSAPEPGEPLLASAGSGAPASLTPFGGRERRILRNAFGKTLVELGAELPNLVVLDADISSSLKTGTFSKRYPERHINFGVAEQDMMLGAAGLATTGLIPVACTYATFATLRACEQIRSFICYAHLNVKIACSHGGLEVGWDGPTHQGTEDIAVMRALPGMTVVVPADAVAASALLRQVVAMEGPVYFRMGRNPVPVIYDQRQPFAVGRANAVRDGSDLTIIATGVMVALALDAAAELAPEGIEARVIDMHTVKPLDGQAVLRAADETGAVLTAEDHSVIGGLGSAVAEYLSEHMPVPILRVGIPDTFCRSGEPEALFAMYRMAAPDIARAARDLLRKKELRKG
jgi:transketolase